MPENRDSAAYFAAIHDADEVLQDALAAIQAETTAGRLTPAEAADERAGLLARHLAERARLRRELLGE